MIGQWAMSLYPVVPDIIVSPIVIVALSNVVLLISMAELALGFWISKGIRRNGPGAS